MPEKSGKVGKMHFQDSFKNDYSKPLCAGEMETRWRVVRTVQTQPLATLAALPHMLPPGCRRLARSVRRGHCAAGTPGNMPWLTPYQGPLGRPVKLWWGRGQAGFKGTPAGGAAGEGSPERASAWFLTSQFCLRSKKV